MIAAPSLNPITLPFGAVTAPYTATSPHKGTDFSYLPDNKIYAPVSGIAIVKPLNGNDGNAIYIQDGDFLHGLLHMSRFEVQNGQQVEQGQSVGIMGDTGLAQGVHLHWALKLNNTFVDPMQYVLKENSMIDTNDKAAEVIRGLYGREPTDGELKDLKGREYYEALRIYRTNTAGQGAQYKLQHYDEDVAKLKTENKKLQDQIDSAVPTRDSVLKYLDTNLR